MIQLQNYIMNCWKHILDKYHYLSNAKRKNIKPKYKPEKLFIKGYDYIIQSKNEELTEDLSDVPPLEIYEKKS